MTAACGASPEVGTPLNRLDLDEVTLVARSQDGDLVAFGRLVDRYQGPLFRLALRMIKDRGSAEDIVQDALVKAWQHLPSLSRPETFPRWMYQITTRRTLNQLRSQRCRPVDTTDPDRLDRDRRSNLRAEPDEPADPALIAEHHALAAALQTMVDRLPEDLRLCWILYANHDRSYEEISDIVEITHSAVRGRIARARHQLAEEMTPWR